MKKELKTSFCCQTCGYKTSKWLGKCPDCGEWQSFIEEHHLKKSNTIINKTEPISINSIQIKEEKRLFSNISEFDRVLGWGLVPGTLILIGGDPGIGKSTLMLQVFYGFVQNGYKVLYVSGEESIHQIKLRSIRLGAISPNILVFSEVNMDSIISVIESIKPDIIAIDSIQTMYNHDLTSVQGSISQLRESAMKLMLLAKKTNIAVFIIGHVTKDGAIAGPKLLEHMVDTVLYFEGDQNQIFRILRAVKNRFGSTNEIGVFEMKEKGLEIVLNPSAVFLSERPINASGSIVSACIEGTRPILVEIQSLVGNTSFGTPRRTILGLDSNRVALLSAVIEKKLGMRLTGLDIFMNVTGGVRVDEPAVDLGIISAIISSFLDKPIKNDTLVIGEVGLTGEVRAVSHLEIRVLETKKMGFTKCLIPENNLKHIGEIKEIEIVPVKNISEAYKFLFSY